MNFNIPAYLIYIFLMVIIIVFVGKSFHRNGRIFILTLFHQNIPLTDTVNNILLVAYYLFNIGYAFVTLRYWQPIPDASALVSSISSNMSVLIFILAVTHYFNMLTLYLFSKKSSSFITS